MTDKKTLDLTETLGKSYTFIATTKHVQLLSKTVRKLLEDNNEVDDKAQKGKAPVFDTDYIDLYIKDIVEGVAKILDLNKEEANDLVEKAPYQPIEDFYTDIVLDYLGIQIPSIKLLKEVTKERLKAIKDGQTTPQAAETTDPK